MLMTWHIVFFLTFNKITGQESLLRQVLSLRSFYFLIKLQLGKKYITCLLSNFPEHIDGKKKKNNNTVTFQEQLSSECSCSFMQYFIFYLKPASWRFQMKSAKRSRLRGCRMKRRLVLVASLKHHIIKGENCNERERARKTPTSCSSSM